MKEKVKIVFELREKYPLEMLLIIAKLSRSTYFYTLKHMNYKAEKDKDIGNLIEEIFEENQQKYGYIRITQELRNRYNTIWKTIFISNHRFSYKRNPSI